MSKTLRLTITYDEPDEDDWIVARVVEVPGAMSEGRTREEARESAVDALRLMLSPDDDDASVAAGRSERLDLHPVWVKLRDLERHLRAQGARKVGEGATTPNGVARRISHLDATCVIPPVPCGVPLAERCIAEDPLRACARR